MKVLQVNKLYHPHIGGVEKHVQDVAEALRDEVDVSVLVAGESRTGSEETVNGVRVIRIPSWAVIQSAPIAPGFYRWFRRNPADIYHLHFPNPVGEIAYLAAGAPGKLVVTYHAEIVRQKMLKRFYAPVVDRLLTRADAILASSPNLIRHSPALQSFQDKCKVLPFAIDTAPLAPTDETLGKAREIRKRYGTPQVLFVGRLIYYKGVKHLIEAMKTIDAQLVIVGEGELESELKQLAGNLDLTDKVHFIGSVVDEDLAAHYHACDLLALPSIASSEAFGFVQLEAHACGRPVVSTNLPTGVPYANLDGRTGLIVPPEDSIALAVAINKLLGDELLRKRLGQQGKDRVSSEFQREYMAKVLLETYDEILTSST